MRTATHCLLRLVALLPTISPAVFAQFTFTSFDVPGVSATNPTAINNNGDIAGTCASGGFIRKADGTFTVFDLASANATLGRVNAINDLGEVAGTATLKGAFGAAAAVGFVRDALGQVTTFAAPVGNGVENVAGLTNAGESIVQVAGGTGAKSFFLRTSADTRTTLPNPAGNIFFTPYTGLNNNGEAAGSWQVGSGGQTDGFVFDLSSQAFTRFDFATGAFGGQTGHWTTAAALNDSGQALGCYFDGTQPSLPVESPDQGGVFQCVDYIRGADGSLLESFAPPYTNSRAVGINQSREITGVYSDSAGSHGFIGIPSTSTARPSITLVQLVAGPPQQAIFQVVDPVGGISNILSIQSNSTVAVGAYTPGQTTPVTVTATKINQDAKAIIGIQATNSVGNITDFDPAFVTVHARQSAASDALTDVPSSEHVLLVVNGDPGLSRLSVHVNGRTIQLPLQPNEKRTLNLQAWMKLDSNAVTFSGAGPEEGQASIALKDGRGDPTPGTGRF